MLAIAPKSIHQKKGSWQASVVYSTSKDYGISGYDFKSPTLTNYFIEKQEIILTFSNRIQLNRNVGNSENFEIAGTDMIFINKCSHDESLS